MLEEQVNNSQDNFQEKELLYQDEEPFILETTSEQPPLQANQKRTRKIGMEMIPLLEEENICKNESNEQNQNQVKLGKPYIDKYGTYPFSQMDKNVSFQQDKLGHRLDVQFNYQTQQEHLINPIQEEDLQQHQDLQDLALKGCVQNQINERERQDNISIHQQDGDDQSEQQYSDYQYQNQFEDAKENDQKQNDNEQSNQQQYKLDNQQQFQSMQQEVLLPLNNMVLNNGDNRFDYQNIDEIKYFNSNNNTRDQNQIAYLVQNDNKSQNIEDDKSNKQTVIVQEVNQPNYQQEIQLQQNTFEHNHFDQNQSHHEGNNNNNNNNNNQEMHFINNQSKINLNTEDVENMNQFSLGQYQNNQKHDQHYHDDTINNNSFSQTKYDKYPINHNVQHCFQQIEGFTESQSFENKGNIQIKLLKERIIETSSLIKENKKLKLKITSLDEEMKNIKLQLENTQDYQKKYQSELSCKNNEISDYKQKISAFESQIKQLNANKKKNRNEQKNQQSQIIEELKQEMRETQDELEKKTKRIVDQARVIEGLKKQEVKQILNSQTQTESSHLSQNDAEIQCELAINPQSSILQTKSNYESIQTLQTTTSQSQNQKRKQLSSSKRSSCSSLNFDEDNNDTDQRDINGFTDDIDQNDKMNIEYDQQSNHPCTPTQSNNWDPFIINFRKDQPNIQLTEHQQGGQFITSNKLDQIAEKYLQNQKLQAMNEDQSVKDNAMSINNKERNDDIHQELEVLIKKIKVNEETNPMIKQELTAINMSLTQVQKQIENQQSSLLSIENQSKRLHEQTNNIIQNQQKPQNSNQNNESTLTHFQKSITEQNNLQKLQLQDVLQSNLSTFQQQMMQMQDHFLQKMSQSYQQVFGKLLDQSSNNISTTSQNVEIQDLNQKQQQQQPQQEQQESLLNKQQPVQHQLQQLPLQPQLQQQKLNSIDEIQQFQKQEYSDQSQLDQIVVEKQQVNNNQQFQECQQEQLIGQVKQLSQEDNNDRNIDDKLALLIQESLSQQEREIDNLFEDSVAIQETNSQTEVQQIKSQKEEQNQVVDIKDNKMNSEKSTLIKNIVVRKDIQNNILNPRQDKNIIAQIELKQQQQKLIKEEEEIKQPKINSQKQQQIVQKERNIIIGGLSFKQEGISQSITKKKQILNEKIEQKQIQKVSNQKEQSLTNDIQKRENIKQTQLKESKNQTGQENIEKASQKSIETQKSVEQKVQKQQKIAQTQRKETQNKLKQLPELEKEIEDQGEDDIVIKKKNNKKVTLTIDQILMKQNIFDTQSQLIQDITTQKQTQEMSEEENEDDEDKELDLKDLSILLENKKKKLFQTLNQPNTDYQSTNQFVNDQNNILLHLKQEQQVDNSKQNIGWNNQSNQQNSHNAAVNSDLLSYNNNEKLNPQNYFSIPFQFQNLIKTLPPPPPPKQIQKQVDNNQQINGSSEYYTNSLNVLDNERCEEEIPENKQNIQLTIDIKQLHNYSERQQNESISPSSSSQKSQSSRNTFQFTTPMVHTNQEQLNSRFLEQIENKGIKHFLQDELSLLEYSNNYYKLFNSHYEILRSMRKEYVSSYSLLLSQANIENILLTIKYSLFKECKPAIQVQNDYNIFCQYFLNRDNLHNMEKSYSYLFQKKNILKKEQMLLNFDPFTDARRQKFLIVFSLLCMHFKLCNLETKILELLEYSVKGGVNYDFIYIFVNTYPQIYLPVIEQTYSDNQKKMYLISEGEINKLISLTTFYQFNQSDYRYQIIQNLPQQNTKNLSKQSNSQQNKGKAIHIKNQNQSKDMKQNNDIQQQEDKQLSELEQGELGQVYDEQKQQNSLLTEDLDKTTHKLQEYTCLIQTLRLIIIIVIFHEYNGCQSYSRRIKIHQLLQIIESFLRINTEKSKIDEIILKQINQNDVNKRLQEEVLGYKKNCMFFQKTHINSFEEDMIMNFMLRFYIIFGDLQLQKWLKNQEELFIHFNYYDFLGSFNLLIEFIKQTDNKLAEKVYANVLKGYFTNPKYCFTILKTLQIVNIYKLIKIISNPVLILEIQHNFQKILEGSSNHSIKSIEYQDVDSSIVQNLFS